MSTHEHPRPPGFCSAGSRLRLVSTGVDVEAGAASSNGTVLGLDGTPAVVSPADTVERCARHADELAGQIEAALRALCGQLDVLSDGSQVELRERVARLVWGQGSTLRLAAAALGELHTVLDELAYELTGPSGGSS